MDWCVQLSGFLGMSVYNPLYFAAMSHCQDWHPVFLGPSGPANPAKNGTAQTSLLTACSQVATISAWLKFVRLKFLPSGLMAWTMSVRVRAFWYGFNDWQQEILEMLSLLVMGFQSCGLITAQVIEFIIKRKIDPWSFCWPAATSAPSPEISRPSCAWQEIYRSVYHV